jgi:hypothetical protein
MDLEEFKKQQESLGLNKETIEDLIQALNNSIEQQNNLNYAELADIVIDKKASNSPHEIIFDITATVLEENEKGEIVATKKIMTKKFHIPVPIDKDYNTFMGVFFDHLEKSILDSANKAHNPEEEKE